MPERDGAAVDVDRRRIEPQIADASDRLRREGFIEFPQVDLLNLESSSLQRLADGRHGADPHYGRIDAGDRGRDDARERRLAECGVAADEEQSGGAVVDAARVAGGDGAVAR